MHYTNVIAITKTQYDNDSFSHPKYLNDSNDNTTTEVYKAPRSEERTIVKINKYILDGINKEKITPKQKREVNSLIGYMNTYRFTHQINLYSDENDRDLFDLPVVCLGDGGVYGGGQFEPAYSLERCRFWGPGGGFSQHRVHGRAFAGGFVGVCGSGSEHRDDFG
jgi:hypothetical protein